MPPRKDRKPSASDAPKASKDPEEVPTLRFGNKSNFYDFKEALSTYLLKNFGFLGRFVEDERYYNPPVPTMDPIPHDTEDAEVKILRTLFVETRKHHNKQILDMEADKPKVYAFIWSNLSQESKEKVQEDPNYPIYQASQDPLSLWLRIARTHIVGDVRISPIALHLAKETFSNLRQGQTESLVQFKKRFDEAITTIEAIDPLEVPSQLERATKLLMSLDKHRYGDLRVTLENNTSRGLETFPQTVNQMFEIASNFKVLTTTGSIIDATAYVTKSTKPKQNGSKDEVKEETKPAPKASKSSKSAPPSPCKYCGGNHWNSECTSPNKKTKGGNPSKSSTSSSNSGLDTVNLAFHRTTIDVRGVVLSSRNTDDDELSPTTINLDSQANLSIFCNPGILDNQREADSRNRNRRNANYPCFHALHIRGDDR